jgi:membrane protein
LVAAANQPKVGLWATIGALGTLVAGATGVFVELQDALNTIWGVQRKTGQGLRYLIKDRLLSFGMVLAIGFLLLVSLILDAGLSALGAFASSFAPAAHIIWTGINFAASLFVITMLFAVIYKGLPDVDIAWRDVWMGAFVTAILFNVGKFLIGYYLGRSSMVSIYGAAGSFIVLLMWIYYSSQIFFFGAEFTRVYAETTGSKQ